MKRQSRKTVTKAKDQRSSNMKEQAYIDNDIGTKPQELNDKAISTKSKEARFKISPQEFEDHTLGEIVGLKYAYVHGSSESARYLHKETTLRGRLLALKYRVKQGIVVFTN
ncbi:hypothetical protein Tco_0047741 [Tanacetum coccineum]